MIDATDATPSTNALPESSEEPSFVELCRGSAMSASETDAVTLQSRTQLVVLAGAEGSGKTTVLASLYEHLCAEAFPGIKFAWSHSFIGFEKICHLNRLASGGHHPDTQRTIPSEERSYYHFAYRRAQDDVRRRHVLLSAMSGEFFRLAMDTREDAERLTYLRRADTIVILVDGQRLADLGRRASAQAEAASLLDSFIDARMLGNSVRVEFAFSKLDRVVAAGAEALNFVVNTQRKFAARFGERVPMLSFRRIAARPDPTGISSSFDGGMAEAFDSWTSSLPVDTKSVTVALPSTSDREFSKFGSRHAARTEE